MGLVVDEILDIAEQSAEVQQIRQVETLQGAAVIQQRVTDLLDVPALLAAQELACIEGGAGMNQPRQLCTFFLQDLLFGVEVEKVQEVIRYQEMTRIPLAPPGDRRADQPAWTDRYRHRSSPAAGPAAPRGRRSCP